MEFLFFLGNQLVYLYRPIRKYTYQIIGTSKHQHKRFNNVDDMAPGVIILLYQMATIQYLVYFVN